MGENTEYLALGAQMAAGVDPHKTAPNPRVGCVVVKEGKIISRGVHEAVGTAHAEAAAMRKLSDEEARGATVYVTLEPCGWYEGKRTPSCGQMLVQRGVERVVVGALDPRFGGREMETLKAAGIKVEYRPNEACERLNPYFSTWLLKKRPYMRLKVASTLDGYATHPDGPHITGEGSRRQVHRWRAEMTAVLTTSETIVRDQPQLNVRGVVDTTHPVSDPRVIVLGRKVDTSSIPDADTRVVWPEGETLRQKLEWCGEQGIDSVLTECGPTMARALMESGMVDEIVWWYGRSCGGAGVPWGKSRGWELSGWETRDVETYGNDVCLRLGRKGVE